MSLPQPSLPPSRSSQARTPLPIHLPPAYRNRQVLAQRRTQSRANASKGMAIEVGAMMGVNIFVAAIALVTIIKLVPHNATQQEQLQSLEAEVTALDNRVDDLRKEFTQYFDPQQAQVNRRQLSDRLNAGQRKLILTTPATDEENVPFELESSVQDEAEVEIEIEAYAH